MDRKGKPEWFHKTQAIEKAGRLLREAMQATDTTLLSATTLVPIPPSKVKSDPGYDDRLMGILHSLAQGLRADIRELVVQRKSMQPAHGTTTRPKLQELISNYAIDEKLVQPKPRAIAIVDDVLTSGAHYKAMQHTLHVRFPDVPVFGIFIARRTPDTSDI